MRTAVLLAAAALATVSVAARNDTESGSAPVRVPGAYMVELADNEDPSSFYENLNSTIGDDIISRKNTTSSVFAGVSFQFSQADAPGEAAKVAQILSMSQVKTIWPINAFSQPKPIIEWTGNNDLSTALLRRQVSDATAELAPHTMTQVDKLHAQNITGAGLRIALVDTGEFV